MSSFQIDIESHCEEGLRKVAESPSTTAVSLNQTMKKHIGCAIHPKWFTSTNKNDDSIVPNDYSDCITKHFSSVVIEHHLKWSPLCEDFPGPIQKGTPSTRLGRYDFYHCDRLVDWAIANKLHVKGHVLMWHVTSPSFLKEVSTER